MIDFFIKYNLVLSVFFIAYKWLFEREKMHQFNRFFLLVGIVTSCILPFIKFDFVIASELPVKSFNHAHPFVHETVLKSVNTFDYVNLFWALYLIGCTIFLWRFCKNIYTLNNLVKTHEVVFTNGQKLVLLNDETNPFTFLDYIFVNTNRFKQKNIPAELLVHEAIHVKERHSFDIIMIELVKVVFWFNPVIYYYKQSIALNHEFIVDEQMIKQTSIQKYQHLLLDAIDNQNHILSSHWNFLLTKSRIMMMTKTSNPLVCTFKKVLVLPLMAVLVLAFCVNFLIAQKKETVEVQKIYDKAYIYSKTTFIIKEKGNADKTFKYNELTKEEQNMLSPLLVLIPEKKLISNQLFESFKDGKTYAVWVDGKYFKPLELEKFSAKDVVYFTKSFVYKNARSNKFPQNYQVHLYTEKGFNTSFTNEPLGGTMTIVRGKYKE